MKIISILIFFFATLNCYYSSINRVATPPTVNEKPKLITHIDTVIYNNKGFSGDRVVESKWLTMNAFDDLYVGVVIYNQSDSVQEFRPFCDPGNFAPTSDSYSVTIPKGKYGKVSAHFNPNGYKYGSKSIRMNIFDKKDSSYIVRGYRVQIKL